RAADREARLYGAELAILHVLPVGFPGAPMTPEAVEKSLMQEDALTSDVIETILERVEELTGRDAGQIQVLVEDGVAEEEILRQDDFLGVDLIVVGSVGAGGSRHRVFGGVAEKVVKRAHASVLVARPGEDTGQIVLATDFSRPAEPAAQMAADEAVRRCARIIAVHSLEVIGPEVALGEPPVLSPVVFGAYPLEEMREMARKRLTDTLFHLGVTGEVE